MDRGDGLSAHLLENGSCLFIESHENTFNIHIKRSFIKKRVGYTDPKAYDGLLGTMDRGDGLSALLLENGSCLFI